MNRILLDESRNWASGDYVLAKVWTDSTRIFGVFASSIISPTIFDGSRYQHVTTAQAYRVHSLCGGDNYPYFLDTETKPGPFIADTYARFQETIDGGIQ